MGNLAELARFHRDKSVRVALAAVHRALVSVDPAVLVTQSVTIDDGISVHDIYGTVSRFRDFDKIYVAGAGKAAAAMADALCALFGKRIAEGAISVPYGERTKIKKKIRSVIAVTEAAHPVPDSSGLEGAKKVLRLLRKVRRNDLLFFLVSGGGSALLPHPAPGLRLSDKRRITDKLLRSGATIQEMNVVRKHLSSIKGGQILRQMGDSCHVVSLILSDVIDDDLSAIASGPTCPDQSTFGDAIRIVRKYRAAPESDPAAKYLAEGTKGRGQETPKPGDPLFSKVHNVLIGNNTLACSAAVNYLRSQGLQTVYLGSRFDGEAKDFGTFLGQLASDLYRKSPVPFAVVLGGETTVSLGRNRTGTGGRNQEAALACAIQMKELPVAIATMGTDGIDGNSRVAGAIVSSKTFLMVRKTKLDLSKFLLLHDSYNAFRMLKSSIVTGRTGTNVNDISLICAAAR